MDSHTIRPSPDSNVDVHPDHGARFVLKRISTDPAVQYDVCVLLPDEETATWMLAFDDEHAAHFTSTGGPDVAPWIDKHLAGLARQLRSAARSDGSWPRRVRRWRAAPES